MIRVAILIAALSACTSFDDLERGVCGNGLVEAGEDCDSAAASCIRCAVACTADDQCPTGAYTCGADGLCHAPSGALGAPVSAGPFQVDELEVVDIDRDGIGDAVGVSSTSIAIRHGDPGARLARAESVLTPSHSAAPAFGDLDGDGATDIALSAADGLVAYGSRFGSLAPMSVSSALVDSVSGGEVDLRTVFQVSPFTIGTFAVDDTSGGLVAIGIITFGGDYQFGGPCQTRLGAVTEQELPAGEVDVYRIDDNDAVVSFVTRGARRELCVLSLHKPAFGAWVITDITPANATGPQRKPILADLETDNDRCPGLVNTDGGGPGLRYWDGAMTGNGCTLTQVASPSGAALPAASQQPLSFAVGRIPLSPTFPLVAADMLVMSDGVYAYVPGNGFGKLYASERRLAGADHADLDGDGEVDGVLFAETEDDVDVLFRRPNAHLPVLPGYLLVRIDTASRVTRTKIGDYDGNGRQDLALVEQLADYQRMLVAYGRADSYLSPPVVVGAFSEVLALAAVPFGGTEDQAGVTDDLLVLQPPPPGRTTTAISVLLGSPLGTMIPFFDPRDDDDPDASGPLVSARERTALTGIVVGRFGGALVDGPDDLLAIAVDTRAPPASAPELWRMPGTDTGPDATERPGIATTGLADCATGVGTGLCVRQARYLAWPRDAGADVVIAVDRATPPTAVRFDPASSSVAASPLTAVSDGLGTTSFARSLKRGDLDGDGAFELIVVAAPRMAGAGAVLTCAMPGGMPTGCEDRVPAIADAALAAGTPITACIDAVPARVTFHDRATEATPAQDLVVACRDEGGSALYRLRGDEVTLLARTSSRIDRIHAGDVTGDGVEDVLAIEGESGAQSLVVFPQCSSREAAACQGGGS